MFFIEADILGDEPDTIVIGLFSSSERAIDGAWKWLKNEREGGLEEDICLCGWKVEPDSYQVSRIDLSNDPECKLLIARFREIEKEFPPVNE